MDILKVILEKAKIVWFLFLRYFCVVWAWFSKLIAIRIQKMKQIGTEKKMEKVYTELGKTVFQLYQEGQQNLLESGNVQQQLSEIQQQLGKKNMLDDKIREIEETYKEKVAKAKEKYEMRKGAGVPLEPVTEEKTEEPPATDTGDASGTASE